MKPAILEDHVEQACLAWLASLGWEVGHGPDISPPDAKTPGTERDSYREAALKHRLRDAIRRLNPHIPAGAQDEACRILQFRPESSLEDKAQWRAYWAWLEVAGLRMTDVFRPRVKGLV